MLKKDLYDLAKKIFPIFRSITGKGNRKTLNIFKKYNSIIKIKKVKTGTKVFDWVIPQEWEINDGYIITPENNKICDIKKNNLHVVSYSAKINKFLNYKSLVKRIHTQKNQVNAIPYVTSYYKKTWGFCMSEKQKQKLKKNGKYKVYIDSKHFNGHLNYGEAFLKGKSKKEILISSYICHPSMANNEVSGPVVANFLLKYLNKQKNRNFSYRFVFLPETIGSITYLSTNLKKLKKNLIAGFNLSCIGDNKNFSYLPSRSGNTPSDIVAIKILKKLYPKYKKYTWYDRGSDERQYCSPGVDLPVATLMRTKFGEYKEYHTSLDRLGNVVTEDGLYGGFKMMKNIINFFETDKNIFQLIKIPKAVLKCEPFMTKRKLYPTISIKNNPKYIKKLMDILTYSDGNHSLISIAEKCKINYSEVIKLAKILKKEKLIKL